MLFTISVAAQSTDQNKTTAIDNLVHKLQQKVLLSEDQAVQVTSILNDYFKLKTQEALDSAHEKIVNLLDKRQKAKYDIVKDEWWNSVVKQEKSETVK
jgi:hypothetical protein